MNPPKLGLTRDLYSQETALPPQGGDVSAGLGALPALAVAAPNEHVSGAGRCVVCGPAWPCERVVPAEQNVAAVL